MEPRSDVKERPLPAATASPNKAPARNRTPPARLMIAVLDHLVSPPVVPDVLLSQTLVSPAALIMGLMVLAVCSI